MNTLRTIEIAIHCPRLDISDEAIVALFKLLDEESPDTIPAGDLSIVFLTREGMEKLHADFLDDPTVTDVITFPGDPLLDFAGEIAICPDVAAEEAAERGIPFAREVTLYLLHGWLHLAGYDDRQPACRAAMRAAEERTLAIVDRLGTIPDFSRKP